MRRPELARAGESMSRSQLFATLQALATPDTVELVVTTGPDQVGRSIVQVSGTSDVLGVLELVAHSAPAGVTLWGLHAGELVSAGAAPRDVGAVAVRAALWSLVGAGGLVVGWSLFLADLMARVSSFGAGL